MSRTLKNQKTRFWVFVVALGMFFGVSGNAVAQSGGFYVGASAGVERASIEHVKTVDSTDVPDDFLQNGNIYNTSDSASETDFGGGLFVGYRFNIDPTGTLYLGAEIDGRFHGGTSKRKASRRRTVPRAETSMEKLGPMSGALRGKTATG